MPDAGPPDPMIPTFSDEPAAPFLVHPETTAIRAGRADNDTALAPILWATTTFVTPTVDEGRRLATSVGASRFYTRYGNPTVCAFEHAVAELEGAETARAFASGMGASNVACTLSPAWRVVRSGEMVLQSTAEWSPSIWAS